MAQGASNETTNEQAHPVPPSSASSSPRVAVFVCHCGGNISDVVDVEKVAQEVGRLEGVEVAETYVFMCSSPGQELIEKAIKEKGCNRIIVAACSPSLHETTFQRVLERCGLNPYLYEAVNIREQCSWCHAHDPDGATQKATSLIAAAVAKTQPAQPLEKPRVPVTKRVVVIGGGIAGLRAALDVAERGLEAVVIESSPFLGGRVAQLHTLYPTDEQSRPILADLASAVMNHPRITIHLYSNVVAASGFLGNFDITIHRHPRGVTADLADLDAAIAACPVSVPDEFNYGLTQRKAIYKPFAGSWPDIAAIDWQACTRCGKCVEAAGNGITLDDKPEVIQVQAGAVIIATGFDHYTPAEGEFGYGTLDGVVTLPQLIRMLDEEGPTGGQLVVGGRPVRRVAIIHCVGSRQQPGIHEPGPDGRLNEYCSRVCCTASLQCALEIRRRFPDVEVFEIFQDIRTYGRDQETNYYEQASKAGVLFFRYAAEDPPQVTAGADGWPLSVKVKDLLTYGEEIEAGVDMVVLAVGIVPRDISDIVDMMKLPTGADGFLLEVHPKLRPVELAIDGVMVAGAAQAPMDTTEAAAAASAAAAKAHVILTRDEAELQPFVAEVDQQKCQGAGECVKACKANAIELVEVQLNGRTVKRARVIEALCKGCGACVPVCPNRAIELRGLTLAQLEAQIVALAKGVQVGQDAE